LYHEIKVASTEGTGLNQIVLIVGSQATFRWLPLESALEEGNVKEGGIVVDKFKEEHFECQRIVKLILSAWHLELCEKVGQILVHPTQQ